MKPWVQIDKHFPIFIMGPRTLRNFAYDELNLRSLHLSQLDHVITRTTDLEYRIGSLSKTATPTST